VQRHVSCYNVTGPSQAPGALQIPENDSHMT
jgi:hypothetical protein